MVYFVAEYLSVSNTLALCTYQMWLRSCRLFRCVKEEYFERVSFVEMDCSFLMFVWFEHRFSIDRFIFWAH